MTDKECRECQQVSCSYKLVGRTFPVKCFQHKPPVMTNLDWMKQPERTAEEVVDFIRSLCTEAAKSDWCDAFDGDCRACLIAYMLARRREG